MTGTRVPRAALILTWAGLLPFAFGALVARAFLSPAELAGATIDPNLNLLVIASDGLELLVIYGQAILSFMGGILWGFAVRAEGGTRATGLVLSVIPTLWVLFVTLEGGPNQQLLALMAGYVLLFGFDFWAWRAGLAPAWWLRLRGPITVAVLICLGLGLGRG